LDFNVKEILTEYQRAKLNLTGLSGYQVTTSAILNKYRSFFKFMDAIVQAAPIEKRYRTYEQYLKSKDFDEAVDYANNVLQDENFQCLTESNIQDYMEISDLGEEISRAELIGNLARKEDIRNSTSINAHPIDGYRFGFSLYNYYKKLHAAENRTPAA